MLAPNLFIVGSPGTVGGAGTKLWHLIELLKNDFNIRLILDKVKSRKKHLKVAQKLDVKCCLIKELPAQAEGTVLAVCEERFFVDGRIEALKERGLNIVWSNEMMFPFKGEESAVRASLIDRVLFVSDFQENAFSSIYQDIQSYQTGNFVDPNDFGWKDRKNKVFSIGRLSRPDYDKFPINFPVFYEEFGLVDIQYRIMAWNEQLSKHFKWHSFGPQWDLLSPNQESAKDFLYSIDLFVYPLGHKVKESWGRAVVESMLAGTVVVVPKEHQFHKFIEHGNTGFLCHSYGEWREVVRELYKNFNLRKKVSKQASDYARDVLCVPEVHRKKWIQALTF